MRLRVKLFLLHQIEGIGNQTLRKLMHTEALQHDILAMTEREWQTFGVSTRLSETIVKGLRSQSWESWIERYNHSKINYVTIVDEAYPRYLQQTADPTVILYWKGDASLLDKHCFALVGTRVATVYGKKVARQFAFDLARQGFCIVSGMASGIDGQAHYGALEAKGATIAVLGSCVSHVYPREHSALYERIAREGLIISEQPLGTMPQAGLFPMRNRIIAGLSIGLLVVEAALKSGSLISADQALEESRDVFAIPGPIHSPKSAGCLELIKQGAKLVTHIDDILQEYPESWSNMKDVTVETGIIQTVKPLTMEEEDILRHLSGQPISFDELLELVQYEFGQLHALLLSLLLKKRIIQHSGMTYSLMV